LLERFLPRERPPDPVPPSHLRPDRLEGAADADVIMVAPRMTGNMVRELYELGKKQKHLLAPTNFGAEVAKVTLNWHERLPNIAPTLF